MSESDMQQIFNRLDGLDRRMETLEKLEQKRADIRERERALDSKHDQDAVLLTSRVDRVDHTLFGNGKPGLVSMYNESKLEFTKFQAEITTTNRLLKWIVWLTATALVTTFTTLLAFSLPKILV